MLQRKCHRKGRSRCRKRCVTRLGISEGDEVVFRVEGNRAVLARTADSCPAGAVSPGGKRNVAWDDVIRKTRSVRASTRA